MPKTSFMTRLNAGHSGELYSGLCLGSSGVAGAVALPEPVLPKTASIRTLSKAPSKKRFPCALGGGGDP